MARQFQQTVATLVGLRDEERLRLNLFAMGPPICPRLGKRSELELSLNDALRLLLGRRGVDLSSAGLIVVAGDRFSGNGSESGEDECRLDQLAGPYASTAPA